MPKKKKPLAIKIEYDEKEKKFINIDRVFFAYKYPELNTTRLLKDMEMWLWSNELKRYRNYEKFIVNWLNKARSELPPKPKEYNQPPTKREVPVFVPDDDWKEHKKILKQMGLALKEGKRKNLENEEKRKLGK